MSQRIDAIVAQFTSLLRTAVLEEVVEKLRGGANAPPRPGAPVAPLTDADRAFARAAHAGARRRERAAEKRAAKKRPTKARRPAAAAAAVKGGIWAGSAADGRAKPAETLARAEAFAAAVKANPGLGARFYADKLGVSLRALSNPVALALHKGFVKKTGERAQTRYS